MNDILFGSNVIKKKKRLRFEVSFFIERTPPLSVCKRRKHGQWVVFVYIELRILGSIIILHFYEFVKCWFLNHTKCAFCLIGYYALKLRFSAFSPLGRAESGGKKKTLLYHFILSIRNALLA